MEGREGGRLVGYYKGREERGRDGGREGAGYYIGREGGRE